jgi:hypothetical protein
VDVIREHAELDNVKSESTASRSKDIEDARKRVGTAEAGNTVDDANRDVQRMLTPRSSTPHVRHTPTRPGELPSGTLALAAPRAQRKLDLSRLSS